MQETGIVHNLRGNIEQPLVAEICSTHLQLLAACTHTNECGGL